MLGFGPMASAPLGSAPDYVPLWFQANFTRQQQKPDEDRIYAAFGRFVASYALAEAGVHIAARFFSGMPDENARIVFHGMSLSTVTKRLKQLVANTPHANSVTELIGQLNLIGNVRNQFVHRLIEYDHGRGLTMTDRLNCKSSGSLETRTFALSELEAMEYDCRVILGRFLLICDRPDDIVANVDISLLGLFGAWRYTRAIKI